MTISFTSPTANPSNAYATSSAKRQDGAIRSNSVNDLSTLRFASRDRFKSSDSSDSSDGFDIPLAYARYFKAQEDPDYEEKATVPSSRTSQADTASLNTQRSRKRDAVWSFLTGKRSSSPTPAMPFPVYHPGLDEGLDDRRWSMQEQRPAREVSTIKRVGNWFLKPFNFSRNASPPPVAPYAVNWLSQLNENGLESSLSMALSSNKEFLETPPSSNDRRTSL